MPIKLYLNISAPVIFVQFVLVSPTSLLKIKMIHALYWRQTNEIAVSPTKEINTVMASVTKQHLLPSVSFLLKLLLVRDL